MVQAYVVDIVSHVPPQPAGAADVTIDGLLDGTTVLELVDSMTYEVLVRTGARQVTKGTFDSDAAWGETQRMLRRWAFLMRSQLDEIAELSSRR